jgi:hypothetical protein
MQIAKFFRFLGWLLLLTPIWAHSQTTTFVYTGSQQTYTLPTGVIGIQIEAAGGGGGGGGTDLNGDGGSGAPGVRAVGIYAAASGTTVYITVGGGGRRGVTSTGSYNCTTSAGVGGTSGGTGGVAGGNGGLAGCNGYSGGGGGGGAATVVRRTSVSNALLVAGGGGGGQGGALTVNGRPGLNSLATTTTTTTISSPATAGGNTTDGGGGGGGGSGCPSGAPGAANPDSAASNTTLQAESGTSCRDSALVSSFAVAATGGAGGAGGVGNGNVGTDGGNGSVTITPLYAGATLQITKAWGANSIAGNVARIGATTGGSANTAAFTSTAPTTASSAPVTVTAGNTITLPAEAMSTGTLANYNTVLSCTAGGGATANALSGTNGQVSNTLLIGAGDAGKAIVCTYTNTFILVPPLTRPVISCSSNGNIFNTAYNGNPAGPAKTLGLDNVWERGATFGAAQPTNWTLASVATVNPGWNAYNAFPASRFIAHQESTSHSGNVDLWYRYVFTMDPSVVVSSFRLAMDFYADNSVDAIYVNGVEQAVPGVPDGNPYLSVHYNTVNALSANLTQN